MTLPDPPLEDMKEGDPFPLLALPVTYTRVCQSAAATWDWFPGHHDPEFARSQGLPTIYVNTMFLQGLSDRAVLQWAGHDARISRRVLRMRSPILAGRTAQLSGTLVRSADAGSYDISTTIETEDGICATVMTTVVRGDRGGS